MAGKKSNARACSVRCNQALLAARRKAANWEGVDPGRLCPVCGASMADKRPHAVYCSRACKTRASDGRRVADGREHARSTKRYPREARRRREYAMQYLRDNPERMRAIRRRRKGQLRREALQFTERDWRRLVGRYRGCCAYCGKPSAVLHRDHVIPLARDGRHSIGNILPACPPCNASKRTSLLFEWRIRQQRATSRQSGSG
ncbi:HNH endonuclease [Geodermatophilus aquaeductus]